MPKLYFHRTSEYANNARNIAIYVDEEKVLSIPNGGSDAYELPEGEHTIYAKIDWCYSPKLNLNLKPEDKIKIEVSAFKMAKWLFPVALIAAVLYFTGTYFFNINATWTLLIILPVFLYQVYFLTFGRKKYLQLKVLNT